MTAVKKLLKQGISVNETSEEGESLLSLACSAGYYELAQVSVLNIIKIFFSVFHFIIRVFFLPILRKNEFYIFSSILGHL